MEDENLPSFFNNTTTGNPPTATGGGGGDASNHDNHTNADAIISKHHEENARSFGLMVADQTIVLVAGTLAFLAALAWNSAAQRELEKHKSLKAAGPWIFALIVTIFAVLLGAALAYVRKEFIGDQGQTILSVASAPGSPSMTPPSTS